jgi:hypothetical protein
MNAIGRNLTNKFTRPRRRVIVRAFYVGRASSSCYCHPREINVRQPYVWEGRRSAGWPLAPQFDIPGKYHRIVAASIVENS